MLMIRRLALFAAIAIVPRMEAQTAVDTTGVGAVMAQALDHSEVMNEPPAPDRRDRPAAHRVARDAAGQ